MMFKKHEKNDEKWQNMSKSYKNVMKNCECKMVVKLINY